MAFVDPVEVIRADTVAAVRPAMARVDAALAAGRHVAGWITYEAAPAFDAALTTRPSGPVPLVCFGVFEGPGQAPLLESGRGGARLEWQSAVGQDDHAVGVVAIREAIAAGDTYQINYTMPLDVRMPDDVDPTALYAGLAQLAEAPYASLISTDDWHVLSLSPELFFRVEQGRLTTRPMKGTARRGRWPAEDEALRDALQSSAKNRAENVMIVDLCRNDLSRVCEWGSVDATSLFAVERYPTVWQMVSTVEGRLRAGSTLTSVFEALFPAGSITGAPKSSSMRLIAQLEQAPRGAYCGAIGYAGPDGRAVFSVGIRTITIDRRHGTAVYGVGGGITWDSAAGDEYAEAMQKAACLTPDRPVGLIETLRVEAGMPVRLDEHLTRMGASAWFLGVPCDERAVRDAVSSAVAPLAATPQDEHRDRSHRLRVTLNAHGAADARLTPLDATPPFPTVLLAASPVDGRSLWLCHKTTRRDVYDRHAAAHPDAWDVLLWNQDREVTEFTRGNVVVELDGRRVTPRREAGLLNGVFRQHLLDAGVIEEAPVRLDDLPRATRLWFINSLREWVEVSAGGGRGPSGVRAAPGSRTPCP